MTTQSKKHRGLVKKGTITAGVIGVFIALIKTFPKWWPALLNLVLGSSVDEPPPVLVDKVPPSPEIQVEHSPQSPFQNGVQQGDCSININGNNIIQNNSGPCSDDETFNQINNWNNNTTEVNESSIKSLESTSVAYSYSVLNSWITAQGLRMVMPVLESEPQNSSFILNTFSNKSSNIARTVLAKQLEAGLRNGTLAPELVTMLGHNPKELVPERTYFTPAEVMDVSLAGPFSNSPAKETLPTPKNSSKYNDCWRVHIPKSGSNFCHQGEHLY